MGAGSASGIAVEVGDSADVTIGVADRIAVAVGGAVSVACGVSVGAIVAVGTDITGAGAKPEVAVGCETVVHPSRRAATTAINAA